MHQLGYFSILLIGVNFFWGSAFAEMVTAITYPNRLTQKWTIETCNSLLESGRIPNPPLSATASFQYIAPLKFSTVGFQVGAGPLGSISRTGPNCVQTLKNALADCAATEGVVGCRVWSYDCSYDCQHTDTPESEVSSVYDNQGCSLLPNVVSDDQSFLSGGYRAYQKHDNAPFKTWPARSEMDAVRSVNNGAAGFIKQQRSICQQQLHSEFRCYHDKMNDHLLNNRGWSGSTHFSSRCWTHPNQP